MKRRTTVVVALLSLACVVLAAGCGEPRSSDAATAEPARTSARTPTPAKTHHPLSAPAEARRLTEQINARQSAAMSQLDR